MNGIGDCEWTSDQKLFFHFLYRYSFMALATDENHVKNCLYQFSFLKLQIVLWQPVAAEYIVKGYEVHFFVNASDVSNVKAHLNASRIPFR